MRQENTASRAISNIRRGISYRINAGLTLECSRQSVKERIKTARCWYLIDSMSSEYAKTLQELLAEFRALAERRPDVYKGAGYSTVIDYHTGELWIMYEGKCLAYAALSDRWG